MKKLLSAMLTVFLLLSLTATLASCKHECEFSSDWSGDDASHWHACTKQDCTEISDKADHAWDNGTITTVAIQEEDGVKTFTCNVCKQTKTEAVAFTGLSIINWTAALDSSQFENFSYKEVSTTSGSGVSVNSEMYYKFTKDNAWAKVTMAEQTQESYAPDLESANEVRNMLVKSIKDMTPYENYAYDAETKTYKATKEIQIASLNASTKDVTLTFAKGMLVEIKYTVSFTQNDVAMTATSTVTLGDYGAVVLNPSAN